MSQIKINLFDLLKTFDLNVQDNIILKGNERCIRQLLSVLLDNALKYSLTKASLSLTENNKTITLICKNDSAHIAKGDLNYFFERFFRQDDDRGVIEGSGIGLSIAQEIVMLHHGKITAYSEKDYEFTIKVLLYRDFLSFFIKKSFFKYFLGCIFIITIERSTNSLSTLA